MNAQSTLIIGILCMIIPILLSIFLFFNSEFLIPKGYDLAIDGYVVSKTLLLICIFHLLSKFGYFLYKHSKQD
ncbi:ABC-type transport system involved in cytochrome bd biosynthesis fused ATPase/permease subunit [Oikeobacillus pervagus]|uniref:ABC-type transport system involved in cytochrome bd biosynthesis fused ATPase/permease subunit n=1 Tax=Oikeobacillus pervagus TaxID=1325931 RepID=A0AAJ1T3F5_9BACI|nr:ABC-type transport system involved in cytochrome bd biosynthesis fused ATPase/permease subunit [Oikeobacillus pervagus]